MLETRQMSLQEQLDHLKSSLKGTDNKSKIDSYLKQIDKLEGDITKEKEEEEDVLEKDDFREKRKEAIGNAADIIDKINFISDLDTLKDLDKEATKLFPSWNDEDGNALRREIAKRMDLIEKEEKEKREVEARETYITKINNATKPYDVKIFQDEADIDRQRRILTKQDFEMIEIIANSKKEELNKVNYIINEEIEVKDPLEIKMETAQKELNNSIRKAKTIEELDEALKSLETIFPENKATASNPFYINLEERNNLVASYKKSINEKKEYLISQMSFEEKAKYYQENPQQ